jgi:hypothetical protein
LLLEFPAALERCFAEPDAKIVAGGENQEEKQKVAEGKK